MLTDTHCHLDLGKFDGDRLEVLHRAKDAGISRIMIPGITVASSHASAALAEKHEMLFFSIGVHPNDSKAWHADSINEMRTLSEHPKAKAIGEIGLDYFRDRTPREQQRRMLIEQLKLAADLALPVIIHMRGAAVDEGESNCASDLIGIIEEWKEILSNRKSSLYNRPGVLHSFSGTLQTARKAIEKGFFIGVTGPVTFHNARQRQAIIHDIPLQSMLLETDAPYMAPHPVRGRRNEPAFVRLVAEKVAEIHHVDFEEVARVTSGNAKDLFNW